MLRALYDYAVQEQLTLPAGYVKRMSAPMSPFAKDGRFLGIMPGSAEKVPCPDIGSMANSGDKCNVLAEKRCILFPADEKQRDKYAAKASYFRSALADAARAEPALELCLNAMEDKETAAAVFRRAGQAETGRGKGNQLHGGWALCAGTAAILSWWEQFRQPFRPSGAKAPCMITGQLTVPMTTVPPISGLSSVGGHTRGDALICFDKDAFCSYGLKQAANAPVSERAFAGVKAALDELLTDAPVLAGMKFVHWYDRPVETPQDVIHQAFGAAIPDEEDAEGETAPPADPDRCQARREATALIDSVKTGHTVHTLPNMYYILLLSGVNGRVMVRAYQQGNYQLLTEHLKQWQEDLALTNSAGTGCIRPVKFRARLIRLISRQSSDRNIF